uniref:Ubiquitously-expressed, prefoldin-like chaperone n=1 Tax=Cyprinus carpio carpio TaxID=630221 RepID=A0A9J8DGA5_CYPCA
MCIITCSVCCILFIFRKPTARNSKQMLTLAAISMCRLTCKYCKSDVCVLCVNASVLTFKKGKLIKDSFLFRPDASKIYVAVGYGFFVEFTHTEALKFIEKKTNQLTEYTEVLTKDAAKIKANIRMVLEVQIITVYLLILFLVHCDA